MVTCYIKVVQIELLYHLPEMDTFSHSKGVRLQELPLYPVIGLLSVVITLWNTYTSIFKLRLETSTLHMYYWDISVPK